MTFHFLPRCAASLGEPALEAPGPGAGGPPYDRVFSRKPKRSAPGSCQSGVSLEGLVDDSGGFALQTRTLKEGRVTRSTTGLALVLLPLFTYIH